MDNKDVVSLDDCEETKVSVKIICGKTKKEYIIDKDYIFVSKVLKGMFEACPNGDTIPIDVEGLEYIVEYMNRQKGKDCIPPRKPLRSKNLKENMDDSDKEWLVNWIDGIYADGKGLEKIYTIISCANFLNVEGLLHLACAKIASLVVEESIENIAKIFNYKEEEIEEKKEK